MAALVFSAWAAPATGDYDHRRDDAAAGVF